MPRANSRINWLWMLQTGWKCTETEISRPFGWYKPRETPLWADFTHTTLNSDRRGQLRCYREHAHLLRLFRSHANKLGDILPQIVLDTLE